MSWFFRGKFILVVLTHFAVSDYCYPHVCDGVDAQRIYSTDSCDCCDDLLDLHRVIRWHCFGLHRNYDEPSPVSASVGFW